MNKHDPTMLVCRSFLKFEKILIIFGLVIFSQLFLSNRALAGLIPSLTPTIGYEQSTEILPTAHQEQRYYYGATARIGWQAIGAEASYLRGDYSNKTFTSGESLTVATQKARVGVISDIGMDFLSIDLGFGAEARTELKTIKDASSNVTSTSGSATTPTINPYAKGMITLRLSSLIAIQGGVVYTFTDMAHFTDLSKQRPEFDLGIRISFHM